MKYRHSFAVDAPLAAVADFHSDPGALRELVPPPLAVRFNKVEPLAEGSIADFTLGVGPVGVRWVAVHSRVAEHGFVDTQQVGPFGHWQHHHLFHAIDEDTTAVIDEIEADYGNLISRFMWLTLPLLFAYRAWKTKAALKTRGLHTELAANSQ